MRNPWGEEWYKGDWSDKSDRWTEKTRAAADHLEDNDGKFFMPFDKYVEQVEFTDFNYDVNGLHFASYAVFGDDEPYNREQFFSDDPDPFNVHYLLVESPVAQNVWLSAHTYHHKYYYGACDEGWRGTEVLLGRPDNEYVEFVNPGSLHDGPI